MSKINWKTGTLLSPVPPVMVSCGTLEKPNIITIAWTGIINSEPPMTYISVRPERYSYKLLKETKEFTINLPTFKLVNAVDFCGVRSGKDVDKFKQTGLTPLPCQHISAPQIAQSPVSLECRVTEIKKFASHDMFLAEILSVNVEEALLDKNGRLCLEKAGLICYSHGQYFTTGRLLGKFGFSVEKKSTIRKRKKRVTPKS